MSIYFSHEIVVYRHFCIFNMASKMAAKGHVTIFLLLVKGIPCSKLICNIYSSNLTGSLTFNHDYVRMNNN